MVMSFTFLSDNGSSYQVECPMPTWGYSILAGQVIGYCLAFVPVLDITINIITLAYTVRAPKLKANTRLFLCSLMICNTFSGVFVLPVKLIGMITVELEIPGQLIVLLCDLGNSFDGMLRTSSIFHLSALAFDEYISICRPFRRSYWLNRKFNTILFVGCWIIPAILYFCFIPPKIHIKGIEQQMECLFQRTKMCQFISNKPFAFATTGICYIVPTAFILICNACTKSSVKKREQMFYKLVQINTKKRSFNRRHFGTKLARIVISLSYSCILCWFPFYLITFIDPLTSYSVPTYMWLLVSWTGYSNSIILPIIYLKLTKVLTF
jgi:hypothetical protein